MKHLGHTNWVIPDLYMVKDSVEGVVPSHESVSIVNTGEISVIVRVKLLFKHAPNTVELPDFEVLPVQAMQLRMDKLGELGVTIPRNDPYSMIIHSSEKVVVEYARLNWIDGLYQSFGLIPYGED